MNGNKNVSRLQRAMKCLAALCWIAFFGYLFSRRGDITAEAILNFTPEEPVLAALLLILLFAVKSLSIFLYSGILYGVSGRLFPIPAAILVNMIGTAVMVTLPYWIGRWEGGGMADRLVSRYPKAARLKRLRQGNDLFFSFLTRFLGILPADIVSLYMGAIGMDYGKYLAGCLLGMLPMNVTFPIMGENITNVRSPQFLLALSAELLFMLLSFVCYRRYRRRLSLDKQKDEHT